MLLFILSFSCVLSSATKNIKGEPLFHMRRVYNGNVEYMYDGAVSAPLNLTTSKYVAKKYFVTVNDQKFIKIHAGTVGSDVITMTDTNNVDKSLNATYKYDVVRGRTADNTNVNINDQWFEVLDASSAGSPSAYIIKKDKKCLTKSTIQNQYVTFGECSPNAEMDAWQFVNVLTEQPEAPFNLILNAATMHETTSPSVINYNDSNSVNGASKPANNVFLGFRGIKPIDLLDQDKNIPTTHSEKEQKDLAHDHSVCPIEKNHTHAGSEPHNHH